MTAFPSLIWKKRECGEQKGLSDSRNTEQICSVICWSWIWQWNYGVGEAELGIALAAVYRALLLCTRHFTGCFTCLISDPPNSFVISPFLQRKTGQGHSISHTVPSPRTWYPHAQKIMEEWTNEWMNGRVKVWSASAAGCLLFQNTASWSLSSHCPEVKGWAEEAWSVRHQGGIMGFESKS